MSYQFIDYFFKSFFLTMNLMITFSQSSIFLVDYLFEIIGTIVRINLIAFNDRTQPLPQLFSQPDIRWSLNSQINWCFFTSSLVYILWHPFRLYLNFNCKLKYIFVYYKSRSRIRHLLNLILSTGLQEFDRRTHPFRHFVQKMCSQTRVITGFSVTSRHIEQIKWFTILSMNRISA